MTDHALKYLCMLTFPVPILTTSMDAHHSWVKHLKYPFKYVTCNGKSCGCKLVQQTMCLFVYHMWYGGYKKSLLNSTMSLQLCNKNIFQMLYTYIKLFTSIIIVVYSFTESKNGINFLRCLFTKVIYFLFRCACGRTANNW